MQEAFLESVKNHLGDRFTEPTEDNFRRLWTFMVKHMTEAFES